MSESNENTKKPKTKNISKIHRRKNEEIPKEFFCPVESCGKAYGSYAALYTHMKNKHHEVKPPNMPNLSKVKNAHSGRPKIKKNENEKLDEVEVNLNDGVFCKICQQGECECVESFDSEENKKTIEIMSCENFANFTNEIGLLGTEEVNWIRRTEEEFTFKSPQQIVSEIAKFNATNNLSASASNKLIDYLSFSSKYWEPKNIDELYAVIYAMIAFQNHQSLTKFVMEGNFTKMQNCALKNPNEFKRLESLVRLI